MEMGKSRWPTRYYPRSNRECCVWQIATSMGMIFGKRPATQAPICSGESKRICVCLVTSILDPSQAPAQELAALYHERWEIETSLDELKTHLRGSKIVLRSKTPELVCQEFYGLMMTHYAVRGLMHEAALQDGEDPDRLSCTHAVRGVRRKLPRFVAIPPSGEKSVP